MTPSDPITNPTFAGNAATQLRTSATDSSLFAKQTSGLEASDNADSSRPPTDFSKQTSTSDAVDSSNTSAPAESAQQTHRVDSSSDRPSPRPTPRAEWIGTTHARRLLGVGSENTIKAWIGYGYLRGRRLPNGRTQVLLQDVLALRASSLITSSSAPTASR